jgi:hypothetical protein
MPLSGERELTRARVWYQSIARRLSRLPFEFWYGQEVVAALHNAAMEVVNEVVYEVYDPKTYERTYKMFTLLDEAPDPDDEASLLLGYFHSAELEVEPEDLGSLPAGTIYPTLMLPEFADLSYWPAIARKSLPRDFLGGGGELAFGWADRLPAVALLYFKRAVEKAAGLEMI